MLPLIVGKLEDRRHPEAEAQHTEILGPSTTSAETDPARETAPEMHEEKAK